MFFTPHEIEWTADTLRSNMENAGFVTHSSEPVAWLNWRGKLQSLISNRRVVKNGLIYIGERRS